MDLGSEWLETDGLGGYASGTVGGVRTRRYHALLCAALAPPAARHVLVNGFDAFVETDGRRVALSSQQYADGAVAPDGAARLVAFTCEPWPTWTFRLEDGTEIVQELFLAHGFPLVALSWRITKQARRQQAGKSRPKRRAQDGLRLIVRPFLTGRDHHALHRENADFRFDAQIHRAAKRKMNEEVRIAWRPYASLPGIVAAGNGAYRHAPHWYRGFLYSEERARGFAAIEDCGSPGEFHFDLAELPRREAFLLFAADSTFAAPTRASALFKKIRQGEHRRRVAFASSRERAAAAFLVERGDGTSIVAGYPWFTDWGRDTFISLRGLCLATGRLAQARTILLEWASLISEGMVPNDFPEQGAAPQYNTVDAALWFVIAVQELLAAAKSSPGRSRARAKTQALPDADARRLLAACAQILDGYAAGTRYGIRMDEDGLLAAGVPGQQLTWMDARAYGREVTPRIGKPVEVQALWLNALAFAAKAFPGRNERTKWKGRLARGRASFTAKFWNDASRCLHDVVDVDHQRGAVDPSIRPNQLFALGALPLPLVEGERARKALAVIEELLVTPMGLNTLAPDDPRYCARYEGGPDERDGAYHQGTVWPWLIGPFVDAWLAQRGATAANRRVAYERYVVPLLEFMEARGVSHLPELADGDPPHAPRGTPFQAWSLAELIRLERKLGSGARR